MTQQIPQINAEMVFTLQEDDASVDIDVLETDWERSLNELRSRQESQENDALHESITITPRDIKRTTPETPPAAPVAHFGDSELDAAYREYLRRCEAEHNARVQDVANDDVDVLIQEDWLAAQTALQSERNRSCLTEVQTVILKPQTASETHEVVLETENLLAHDAPTILPELAIHVYQLPNLHTERKLRVVNERDLMQGIVDKLKPHLSNAVAGMVRQAVQKKLATISYDLQIALNDETPKIVQEVLEHNLDVVFRTVKNRLRD